MTGAVNHSHRGVGAEGRFSHILCSWALFFGIVCGCSGWEYITMSRNGRRQGFMVAWVYNRPIPSEKIAPWQPSQSRRPAILVHFKAICFLWLLSFSIKIPQKSSGIQEEVMSLDFLTQASRGRACSLESKRSPAENGRSALISLERWRKATVRCPVVMMRTLWTVLTKICNVQFVMWLYETRFWLDVAIDFVKNAWSDTWRGTLNISFCYLILPHGCKKKKIIAGK